MTCATRHSTPLLVEAMDMASVHSLRGPARPPRRAHSGLGRGGPCGAAAAASSLSAAEAIRDANAVVLAGALAPSKSQAWGISEAYTPVNFPPVLRRDGQQQLSSFYRQLLQPAAEADYVPACGDLQLAESAERAAGRLRAGGALDGAAAAAHHLSWPPRPPVRVCTRLLDERAAAEQV